MANVSEHVIRWERTFYSSYGNYTHYRFKDFCMGCEHKTDEHYCQHPERKLEHDADCQVDLCPMVDVDWEVEEANLEDENDEVELNHDTCILIKDIKK